MAKNQLMAGISKSFSKATLQLKKHSPEILVVAGVIGTVTSAVLACRATTKASKILEETKETLDIIHTGMADGEIVDQDNVSHEYTEEDGKKDLTITYAQTGLQLVKLYAPAVILGALSITSMVASNNILRKRNVALAAAYATVEKGFKEYRGRVVERFGEAVDRELKYNIKAKQIEETVVDEKTGKEKKVKKTVPTVSDKLGGSPYATLFDEASRYWEKDAAYNLMFLRARQQQANDMLRANRHLFLNDVLKMLDLPITPAGQVVGWVYNEEDPNGDNYVDFGLYEMYKDECDNGKLAFERTYLLDFNVDGDIWSLMKSKKYGDSFKD
jgi:hypothetical protein